MALESLFFPDSHFQVVVIFSVYLAIYGESMIKTVAEGTRYLLYRWRHSQLMKR